jgi:U3 small nucleolar ribonucleoprotein protein IMP4
VRRIGRDLAFAAGGRYVTRGKGGLSSPPLCDGTVLVLSREGRGIRMQILDGMREPTCLRFPLVKEERRIGLFRRGLFTGNSRLLSSLPDGLPVCTNEDLPDALVLDGVQGRRVSLGVGW